MSDVWRRPPADWTLSTDRVDLWQTALDRSPASLTMLARLLSADERRRADRFRFAVDRERYVAGRGILRTLLGRYLNAEPGEIRFLYGPQGRPELAEPFSESALRFNLSHAQDLALFAFTIARSVGVDVERLRPVPDAEQITATLFPQRSRDLLRDAPAEQREALFVRFWTETEALHKASGAGLGAAEFGDTSIAEPALWRLEHLVPRDGFIAGLAVEGHDWQLRRFHWDAKVEL